MAKKISEIKCPSCGATITKDYFLENYDCPNCHDDLSDEDDILAAFGLNEKKDEPEDIFEQLLKGSRYGEKTKGASTSTENVLPFSEEVHNEESKDLEEQIDVLEGYTNTSEEKHSIIAEEEIIPEESKPSSSNKTDAMSVLKAALSRTLDSDEPETQTQSTPQRKNESLVSDTKDVEKTIAAVEKEAISFETDIDTNDTFISEEDFINDDLYSGTSETKLVKDNSLESLVDNIEDDKLDDTRTKKDNLLSAADFIRAKLSNTNEDNGPKIIDMEKRENVPDDFNSNWDGYYDDTKSTIPPEPDVVNFKTVRRVVGSIVGIILVSIFLIYWA